jgi:hypothetical protein
MYGRKRQQKYFFQWVLRGLKPNHTRKLNLVITHFMLRNYHKNKLMSEWAVRALRSQG